MMDSVDVESIEKDIKEILEANDRSMNGTGSEDVVDELKFDLGERLGLQVYVCDGPNDFTLDKELLAELQTFGALEGGRFSPTLVIEDPKNPENQVEVKIIDPTDQE